MAKNTLCVVEKLLWAELRNLLPNVMGLVHYSKFCARWASTVYHRHCITNRSLLICAVNSAKSFINRLYTLHVSKNDLSSDELVGGFHSNMARTFAEHGLKACLTDFVQTFFCPLNGYRIMRRISKGPRGHVIHTVLHLVMDRKMFLLVSLIQSNLPIIEDIISERKAVLIPFCSKVKLTKHGRNLVLNVQFDMIRNSIWSQTAIDAFLSNYAMFDKCCEPKVVIRRGKNIVERRNNII
ncbi:hypothetical protein RF11_00236 [Thelohanellus kitauei]|uniref:Uncharacterized protein n=1 Tax=Thelohanellus kitauei TaxID=669202 RepID=A0A0C2N542_THEKT|nr:hypothetical protein RF11_00236 [Thelohanellus kitauei]